MGKYSDYYGVTKGDNWQGENKWIGTIKIKTSGHTWIKHFDTERQAAIGVDMKLIELKREPRNILKKKKDVV